MWSITSEGSLCVGEEEGRVEEGRGVRTPLFTCFTERDLDHPAVPSAAKGEISIASTTKLS